MKYINCVNFFSRMSQIAFPRSSAGQSRRRAWVSGGCGHPHRVHQRGHPHGPRPTRRLLPGPVQVLQGSSPRKFSAAEMFGARLARPEAQARAVVFGSAAEADGDVQHGVKGGAHSGFARSARPGVSVAPEELLLDARRWILQSHLHRWPALRQGHQEGQKRDEESIKLKIFKSINKKNSKPDSKSNEKKPVDLLTLKNRRHGISVKVFFLLENQSQTLKIAENKFPTVLS